MCELTFANLGELNPRYFLHQTIINARSNNNDGLGYIQNGKYWKTKLSAQNITNLGSLLRDAISADPMAVHVRYASNKSLNEDCHSHPFPTDSLIVMHNGKLEMKEGFGVKYTEVDSQVFTENLEAEIQESKDIPIVELLPKVMENWYGKFAFMIYDLRDSNFYVVRGASADLHQATINGKLVVNTVKADLQKAMHDLRQHEQLMFDRDIECGEITELDKETIYWFDPEAGCLVKVGEVKENKAPLSATAWQSSSYGYGGGTLGSFLPASTYQSPTSKARHKVISDWIHKYSLTLPELHEVCLVTMGCSFIELTKEDIDVFIENVLVSLSKQAYDDTIEIWKAVRKIGKTDWAYEQEGFSFPWMLNTTAALNKILELAEAEVEKDRKTKAKSGGTT